MAQDNGSSPQWRGRGEIGAGRLEFWIKAC